MHREHSESQLVVPVWSQGFSPAFNNWTHVEKMNLAITALASLITKQGETEERLFHQMSSNHVTGSLCFHRMRLAISRGFLGLAYLGKSIQMEKTAWAIVTCQTTSTKRCANSRLHMHNHQFNDWVRKFDTRIRRPIHNFSDKTIELIMKVTKT